MGEDLKETSGKNKVKEKFMEIHTAIIPHESQAMIYTLYCKKYLLICLNTHMNLSDLPFLIHRS